MRSLGSGVLEGVDTTLNAVQQDVSALEIWVHAPAAEECDLTALLVILGVAVEETGLLEQLAAGLAVHGADIDNAETAAVVGLVGEAVEDVLVVVDGLDGGLVGAGEFRFAEVLDVKDVGSGVAVGSSAGLVHLIELIVEEEEVHLDGVGEPALVGVCGTGVRSLGENLGLATVGDIHDGEGVFVVVEANFSAPEANIWASVDNALS